MSITLHRLADIPGVHPKRPDPYLIWAQLTGWVDLVTEAQAGKPPKHAVPLIAELIDPRRFDDFRSATEVIDPQCLVTPAHRSARHVTVWIDAANLGAFAALADAQDKPFIERFDICQPIWPRRLGQRARFKRIQPRHAPLQPRGTVLIGVIDNGCPFAHASLVNWDAAGSKPSTRIAALWDMRHNGLKSNALLSPPPASLHFGREFRRDVAKGLDSLLMAFIVAPHTIDETGLYRSIEAERPRDEAARPLELRRHVSHGAHVLDVLAGRVPLRQRVALDADTPPGWAEATDAAADPARSDVVFVQLPSGAVQDNSGGWLGSHVLDAMRYILGCAVPGVTTDVVINLSYGGTAGPHNGSSLLECAIDELIEQHGVGKPAVHVFIAAGNAFAARSHAVLAEKDFAAPDETGRRRSRSLAWHVPADAETPSFMELWMPKAWLARKPVLSVTPPGDAGFQIEPGQAVTWPQQGAPQATIMFLELSSRGNDEPMVLLAISPTSTSASKARGTGDERPPAPHGNWAIYIDLTAAEGDALGELHAYIARNDRDIGTLRRGRPSYFVDEHDDPSRYLRRAVDDPGRFDAAEIEPPRHRAGSTLRRRGTLSATANGTRTKVAAGYEWRSEGHAAYSSAGPSRSNPARRPSASLVTDLSSTLPGIRAGGNYSGATFRLVGTSSAAPQLARKKVAELVPPSPQRPPSLGRPPPASGELQDPEDLFGDADKLTVGHPGPVA